jgi:hypothetical protein
VRLLTHLTPSAVAAVECAVGHTTVRNVDGYAEFQHAIRTTPVDAVVVDPGLFETDDVGWVALLGRYTTLPLALHARLSPGSARAISLAHLRAPYIVIQDVESESPRLIQFVTECPPTSLDRQVLARIAEQLGGLPRELAIGARLLFTNADHAHTVDWLATSAARSRRWVERQLTHAGFASAARLAMAPWFVRAYHYLRDDAFTQRDVARKVGVASPRTLWQELGLLGLHSRQDVRATPSNDMIGRVVGLLVGRERAM